MGETRTRLITAVKWIPTVSGICLYIHPLFTLFIAGIVTGALVEYRKVVEKQWPKYIIQKAQNKNANETSKPGVVTDNLPPKGSFFLLFLVLFLFFLKKSLKMKNEK